MLFAEKEKPIKRFKLSNITEMKIEKCAFGILVLLIIGIVFISGCVQEGTSPEDRSVTPEISEESEVTIENEEEILQEEKQEETTPAVKQQIYKGIWLPGMVQGWLASNIDKIKALGMNTVSLSVEFIQEDDNPLVGIDTSHIAEDIKLAHDNGMKVMLNANFHPKPKLGEEDIERLNSLIIEVAKIAEENDVELFAPLSEPETVLLVDRGEWAQDILHKIKEVYHGETFWNGAFAPPDKEVVSEEYFRQVAEQPPGDFVGYDYIGFPSYYWQGGNLEPEELLQFADQMTLESYSEYADRLVKYMLAYAERDGCKGVIVKEFGVIDRFFMRGSDVVDRLDNGTLTEEEYTESHRIVLEKGKDKVAGFMTTIDILDTEIYGIRIRGIPETQEVIREWFTEKLPEER